MKECMICLGDDWLTETKCNHIICIECIFKLEKDECPMCRREIKKSLKINDTVHVKLKGKIQKVL